MDVTVKEKTDKKIKLEIDADLAFINLLNDRIWEQPGVKFSAYQRRHPYVGRPELVVRSSNPNKTIIKALDHIIADCQDLEKKVNRILK